jgi:hypothetical protein
LSQSPALYDFELPCHPFRDSSGRLGEDINPVPKANAPSTVANPGGGIWDNQKLNVSLMDLG